MLSQAIQTVLQDASEMANRDNSGYITLDYLLLAMCKERQTADIMLSHNVDIGVFQEQLKKFIKDHPVKLILEKEKSQPTLALQRVLGKAEKMASSLVHQFSNDPSHSELVLRAMLDEDDSNVAYLMNSQGIFKDDLNEYLVNAYSHQVETSTEQGKKIVAHTPVRGELPQNSLSSFTTNLNEQVIAAKGDPLVGRVSEMNRIIQILARQRKNNPLLIGESGVGKTAIVRGLSLAIEEGEVPQDLLNCEVLSLDVPALLAGTRYRGDFEKRVKSILNQLEKKRDLILFIDDVHSLIGAGTGSSEMADASSLFKPAIMNSRIRCIGATNHEHYRTMLKRDLTRHFQKVDIKPMTNNETYRVLEAIRPRLEQYHNVSYTKGAIKTAIDLSDTYISGRYQPDKAIDVLDEAGAFHKVMRGGNFVVGEGFGSGGIGYIGDNVNRSFLDRLDFKNIHKGFRPAAKDNGGKNRSSQIDSQEIQGIIAQMTGLPIENLRDGEQEQIRSLQDELRKRIFGQDKAIEELVNAIKLARAGLNSPNRPLGSFMLAGPTGVGKTEVCKQLAKHGGINLIRYDMSEYSESHTIARLVGAPPGYVGFDSGSQLTSAVIKNPHSIVLFDEMEKAHPNIYNLLLQIMDYGCLSDSTGQECDFRNTLIIVTTNAGGEEMQRRSSGFSGGENYDGSREIINTFSPEFRNRLDAIIQFSELSLPVMEEIVIKFMDELQEQIEEKGVVLEMDARARKWLASAGFDSTMGARPLIRLVKEQIKMPLADMMLFHNLAKQGGVIKISLEKDRISLNRVAA